MPEILKLSSPSDLREPILRERIERGYCSRLQGFLASHNGEEAGLLLYEDWSERKSGFIYEIFILSSFRKKGLGTLLLLYAEKHAIQLNCDVLRLKPYALAQEPDNILLRNWYEKNGYQQYTKDCEFMTKYLKSPILSINF
jgi:GNAT superfamily N-acetyltransferase